MNAPTLERGVRVFLENIDAPIATFLSSCVNCGLCAESCLFFTETRDPRYTPIYKLRPLLRVWRQHYTVGGKLAALLGLAKPLIDAELAEWETLIYDSCTLCGRCSVVCPVGNDIAYMIRKAREGMAAAGHAPPDLVAAAGRAVRLGSVMGVKLETLKAQIRHVEADTGLTIPFDRQGADYMLLLSAMEVMNYPEFLGAVARIFDHAKVEWTLSSQAFEATNPGVQIGVSEIARELVQRVVDAAETLGVKHVISPECGHAYTALRWDGPNLIGRPYNFKAVHIFEVLDRLRAEGRIRTKGRDQRRITFHDPCQIVRRGGVIEEPRRLADLCTEGITEMEDSGVLNWCCGGGGGVSANERAHELKIKAFNRKKRQLEQTGAKTMMTACANCRITLEEGLEAYEMNDVEVIGLTETLADYLDQEPAAGRQGAPGAES